MLSGQTPTRQWNTRRSEKARRLASVPVQGKVLPTGDLVAMLEKLIAGRQSRSGRQQPEAGGFPFPFTGGSEPANRARSAYDHAERGPQRTSGHL